jgi:cytidine deaminase
MTFTPSEQRLLDHAQQAIVSYNKIRHSRNDIDTLYAFILSDSGQMHDGACFEPNIAQATICGERHAISTMMLQESTKARIQSIVVADPVPEVQERGTPPCGTCRHLIWTYGLPDASVILLQYIQTKQGWTFPTYEKHPIAALYPLPYEPKEGLWDGWEPRDESL